MFYIDKHIRNKVSSKWAFLIEKQSIRCLSMVLASRMRINLVGEKLKKARHHKVTMIVDSCTTSQLFQLTCELNVTLDLVNLTQWLQIISARPTIEVNSMLRLHFLQHPLETAYSNFIQLEIRKMTKHTYQNSSPKMVQEVQIPMPVYLLLPMTSSNNLNYAFSKFMFFIQYISTSENGRIYTSMCLCVSECMSMCLEKMCTTPVIH